jgi:DNA-binding transcriptional MerR regulator
MGGYRISELAHRTGFPASTLRYYEQEGLLEAPARTAGGYRSYDDAAVERLKFISRARHLGLPLEEVRELIGVWSAGSCVRVQERLAELVDARIADIGTRVADLDELRAQLAATREELGRHVPAGPCDDDCGCLAAPGAAPAAPPPAAPPAVRLRSSRAVDLRAVRPADGSTEPVACTLSGSDRQARLDDWADLLGSATGREHVDGGVRLTLPAGADVAAGTARLAALEQQCCRFFDFTLEIAAHAVTLTVRAPADAREHLDAVFGGGR